MKKVLFLFLVFPLFLSAQINESDTLKFKANLSLSGIWQDGNVQTWIFRAKSGLTYKQGNKWVFKTQNSYVYQAFGGAKADEDILSLNFIYFDPERKFYPLVLGFVSTNFRRQIDLRYILGVGGTYQVFNKKKSWLKFSVSSEYEETEFINTNFNFSEYNGTPSINTFRGTLWVNGKYYLLNDKVILGHESYFQPSLSQRNNFRWQVDLALEFPLSKYFNFKINYLHSFESLVIENQQQRDRFLTFGFTLKSY